ncbi:MAG: hypothetical protein CSA62_10655 [Planctomycetota bacterium]|nr:MAG: hypothetical protein CSA62_10655 [Planctomycetota bacterium]
MAMRGTRTNRFPDIHPKAQFAGFRPPILPAQHLVEHAATNAEEQGRCQLAPVATLLQPSTHTAFLHTVLSELGIRDPPTEI